MFDVVRGGVKDLPVVRRLADVIFPHTYGSIITDEQVGFMLEWMYSTESLQKQLDDGQQLFLLMSDGEPVGFMTVEPQGELLFHLQKLYVLPSIQGKGAGRVLIGEAEAFVRSSVPKGKTAVLELNVNRHNKAKQFYEKMGFVVDREVCAEIGNGFFMDDYIMKKEVAG